jgi:ubiquinone/menaquinone biosynthesis C-methylase UbiE
MRIDEVQVQRDYYKRTADQYDQIHVTGEGEHDFALAFMVSMISFLQIRSILDIGSGTGRALTSLKKALPNCKIVGLEPSAELRGIGYEKGLASEELIDGDAQKIQFPDGSFDLVSEFGSLHHIPNPSKAVAEMLRVASKAIFISDSNNFGQGSTIGRLLKQAINSVGLWKVADFIKTRGRGYTISEGDGLAYSYSVFDDYETIENRCRSVHILNTVPAGVNPYRTASHVALLGIK